jgi:signal transduction histidine kinase
MQDPSQNAVAGSPEDFRARIVELESEVERLKQAGRDSAAALDDRYRQLLEQQKQEALGVLATGIAHAFNNILTGVLGYTELAARELEPDSLGREFLDEVTQAARRGAELTAQLLLHAGKGRFNFKEVNLSTLVQDMARQLICVVPKQAILRFETTGSCPSIQADPDCIRQLLTHLVSNAGEALGDRSGKITVRSGTCKTDSSSVSSVASDGPVPAGRYASLAVVDTGSGMNEATLTRIFEPFFTTRFIGRGLGLSAVRGIVRGHRGYMRVTSKPGKGSTFEVLFPATPEDAKLEASEASAPPVSS